LHNRSLASLPPLPGYDRQSIREEMMAKTRSKTLKARTGMAMHLARGQTLSVINTHGSQVVDLWAFRKGDATEFMSMPHCRNAWFRIAPRVGDALVTNLRNPILTLIEDTSPGIHDTLVPSCDEKRYRQLGFETHASCAQNFHDALAALGVPAMPVLPAINLFMNVPIQANGTIGIAAPLSQPGDKVVLRAEMECTLALSACPHDVEPFMLNGRDCTPKDVEIAVGG
jgi:hypothetical protein